MNIYRVFIVLKPCSGFVAETLKKDPRKCWPFSEESLRLVEKKGFTLPPLSVPESKWWSCTSCVRDIDADEPKGTYVNIRQKILMLFYMFLY